jgi:hypothetical protein
VHVLLEGGQIDDAEQLARFRLMNGRCRARPGLHHFGEVLAGEDLHRVIGG